MMPQALVILWKHFFAICRFQAGPQDLPASPVLLALCLAAYAALTGLLNIDVLPLAVSLLAGVLDALLLTALTASLLYLAGHAARLAQTLTALAGTGFLLNLFGAPLVVWLNLARGADTEAGLPGLLLFLLLAWSLSVTAHIFRHALSTHFGVGLGIAFVITLVSISVLTTLFPVPSEFP